MKSVRTIEHGMKDHIIAGLRIPFTQILLLVYSQKKGKTNKKIKIGFFKNI